MRWTTRPAVLLPAVIVLSCTGSHPVALPEAARETLRLPAAGPVLGFETSQGSHSWLGIPYAAAPVGPLRWRAPRPAPAWTEIRPALQISAACPQFSSLLGADEPGPPGSVTGDEDCLYLNIHAPALAQRDLPARPGRGLPVMLWVHGGGNTMGHGGFYRPDMLAASQGVVVVTVNYRLGVLGWFRHPALRDDSSSAVDNSGNFALLDLVQALRWVRDNIAAFGGEPGNVTIFGESAGGQNVLALLASPLSRGLFQHAIVQSGIVGGASTAEAENLVDEVRASGHAKSSTEVLLRLLVLDGLASDRISARAHLGTMSAQEIATYLRGKSPEQMLAPYRERLVLGMYFLPILFRDGVVLPELPLAECFARSGCFHQVPVMLGTNRDETKLFQFFDPEQVSWLFGVVPVLRDPAEYQLRAEYLSAQWKAQGADEIAQRMMDAGWPRVFVYRFDWDEEPNQSVDLGSMLGAAHALEIPFVHGRWFMGQGTEMIYGPESWPGRRLLSAQMMSYWSAFASDGDPGSGRGGDLPTWEPWLPPGSTGPGFMVLDTPAGGGLRRSSEVTSTHSLLGRLDGDSRLASGDLRCRLRQELTEWFSHATATSDDKGCPGAAH
ncbi:MAG: carboxylesterase family protein [Pseudomonadota bacterium]